MSCSVAVSNSPAFSPSSSLFLNKTPIISPSTEALNLTLTHLKTSSSPASPSPSPSSPFRLRLPKPPPVSLLSSSSASNSSPSSGSGSAPGLGSGPVSTVLKRKRPARLEIPVATEAMSLGIPATPCEVGKELEREGDGYSVYCKRGRREAMEDRFSASVELQGDTKQAIFGIFDGHGGAKAAEFAAQKLEKNILDQVITRRDNTAVMDAVKQGYLKTDAEFFKEDNAGGTCCLTALIQNGDLVGGFVDLCRGVWRIQGSLAVSRGIGDRHLKQWVIAEPETKIVSIKPDCEFLILASDGLWDKVSNQEAVDIVRPSFIGTDKPNLLFACKKLVDLSVSRGSFDDISVMLVQL
ncbi:hypothetical protein Gotri_024544, partial [Gossypium trilobum]|nr:hypothetical protein [Gossypium trilobum]